MALYGVIVFNRLIGARNRVHEAFSGIDVQLRRRSELVPNLVEVVKGYATHERSLFEEIVKKRNVAIAAAGVGSRAAAEQDLQGALHRLLAVAEAYPELKANQNFLALQAQLAELEDQLQMARRYYNGSVRDFNTGIQQFPDLLVARIAGFREQPFFQIDDASAATPSIAFGDRPA